MLRSGLYLLIRRSKLYFFALELFDSSSYSVERLTSKLSLRDFWGFRLIALNTKCWPDKSKKKNQKEALGQKTVNSTPTQTRLRRRAWAREPERANTALLSHEWEIKTNCKRIEIFCLGYVYMFWRACTKRMRTATSGIKNIQNNLLHSHAHTPAHLRWHTHPHQLQALCTPYKQLRKNYTWFRGPRQLRHSTKIMARFFSAATKSRL